MLSCASICVPVSTTLYSYRFMTHLRELPRPTGTRIAHPSRARVRVIADREVENYRTRCAPTTGGRARRRSVDPAPRLGWPGVAAFALIHGGGGSAWDWHLVVPELRGRGHDPVAVDLPSEDAAAGWTEYEDA